MQNDTRLVILSLRFKLYAAVDILKLEISESQILKKINE